MDLDFVLFASTRCFQVFMLDSGKARLKCMRLSSSALLYCDKKCQTPLGPIWSRVNHRLLDSESANRAIHWFYKCIKHISISLPLAIMLVDMFIIGYLLLLLKMCT